MDSKLRITSGAVSDRGLSEKRPENEDSYLEMGQCGIFAVADGVGGAQAGEVASQMAMEILAEAFTNRQDGIDAETVMRSAIEQANAAINQMARELPQLSNMATTVVALHLAGNTATICHVGDSRLYRVNRDGILYRETADHSMVAEEVRAGRMTEEQAESHPSRNIISRALGAESTVEVDLKTILVEPGTAFLICSDGITRHVADQEIKGVLTFGGAPPEICDYLKDLCYERGAEDNLTAVVVKVSAGEDSLYNEDPTVATARSFEDTISNDDENHLLEIGTNEFIKPETPLELYNENSDSERTIPIFHEPQPSENISQPETPQIAVPNSNPVSARQSDTFSMFGDSGSSDVIEEKQSSIGRIATAIAMVILGTAIGLGVYHFALLPKPADTAIPQLSVMRSDNIPLSAFEENRRNVDKDPAGYIAKFASDPRDVDDYYLLGRAYLLTGDYTKARLTLTEARTHLPEADPSNAKVLASDIAIAMAVTNDTTIQTMLKKELDAIVKPAANTNSNR